MSPTNWGPSTWIFMHTLACKVKEESFPSIKNNIIMMLIQICNNLPCPECAQHAKEFWAKVKTQNILLKTDLINLLFVFHNMVNKRKRHPPFKYENLSIYESRKVIETYNLFSRNFNTRGNMNLINESFHRNMMLANLKQWLMTNIQHFNV
jgi:hypothetical protein